ncbi:Endoplasmic reticulum metallopeptidase 1 [Cichlidogyrus casuarinus]|uniref:Endoplasmic reticulum metallopeptidase 1 n=1 Tax=Cichlidogyrus casuarinus TaxID=1844966 RepID=A0ABD2QBK0_9PLAT
MYDLTDSAMFFHFCLTVLVTLFSPASSYATLLWVYGPLAGLFLGTQFQPNCYSKLHLVLAIIPNASFLHAYCTATILNIFIPIMGRSGQQVIPDLLISAIICLLFIPVLLFISGALRCTREKTINTILYTLTVLSVLLAILLRITPLGFPYNTKDPTKIASGKSPVAQQRVHLFHANNILRMNWRNFSEEQRSSALHLYTVDTNTYRYVDIRSKPSFLSSLFSDDEQYLSTFEPMLPGFEDPCNISLPYCGMAYHYPFANAFGTGFKIPVNEEHQAKPEPALEIQSKGPVTDQSAARADRPLPPRQQGFKRINLTISVISGPPHNHFYVRTEPEFSRLISWSFDKSAGIPKPMALPNKSPEQVVFLISLLIICSNEY